MPKRTLEAIKKLKPMGLTSERFKLIHHLGVGLKTHEHWCETHDSFNANKNGVETNDLVRRRLELIYVALTHDRSSTDRPVTDGEWRAALVLALARFPLTS